MDAKQNQDVIAYNGWLLGSKDRRAETELAEQTLNMNRQYSEPINQFNEADHPIHQRS